MYMEVGFLLFIKYVNKLVKSEDLFWFLVFKVLVNGYWCLEGGWRVNRCL